MQNVRAFFFVFFSGRIEKEKLCANPPCVKESRILLGLFFLFVHMVIWCVGIGTDKSELSNCADCLFFVCVGLCNCFVPCVHCRNFVFQNIFTHSPLSSTGNKKRINNKSYDETTTTKTIIKRVVSTQKRDPCH